MSYAEHLRALLRPLGVYQLSPQSLSGGELEALGAAFDALREKMEADLREALPCTAEAEGLTAYESLFGYPRLCHAAQRRRSAILGLLRMPAGCGDAAALEAAMAFTGTTATIDTQTLPDHLTVTLGYAAQPAQWAAIRRYLLSILPAHLETRFVFTGT